MVVPNSETVQAVGVGVQANGITKEVLVDDQGRLILAPTGTADFTTTLTFNADYNSEITIATWNAGDNFVDFVGVYASIADFLAAEVITFRWYQELNGVESLVKSKTVTKGTDPDIVRIVEGGYSVTEQIRITAQYTTAAGTTHDIVLQGLATNTPVSPF